MSEQQYPNHDWTIVFRETRILDNPEFDQAIAEIEAFQPYSTKQLYKAGNYLTCPNCGHKAEWHVYQVGENEWTGAVEEEFCYQCWTCGWSSTGLEWNGYDDD